MKNRVIKFRGIDIKTNKWVYGDLVVNKPTQSYRIVSDFALVCNAIEHKGVELVGCSGSFHNVQPKSVGEFTGLKDKNGREIYRGDIIEQEWTEPVDEMDLGKVVYDDSEGMYHIRYANGGSSIMTHRTMKKKVVGNIHENPELL